MAKYSLWIVFLLSICITVISETFHIRAFRSPSDLNENITLYQFVNNSSNYLKNETRLIFAPGNYTLESELIIEDIHSFSISVDSCIPSSKVVIICVNNARIGFRDVKRVIVSGVNFDECIETEVLSVDWFKLENSTFYCSNMPQVNGIVTTLIVDHSTASLDRVAFVSKVTNRFQNFNSTVESSDDCIMDSSIGISVKTGNISIIQSWFTGLVGAAIHVKHGSNMMVFNSTFVNNKPLTYIVKCRHNYHSILYANRSTVKIHDSNFEQNGNREDRTVASIIATFRSIISIIQSKFVSNTHVVDATDSDLQITYSEFVGNFRCLTLNRTSTNISHSKFINNNRCVHVLSTDHTNMINIHHSKFVNSTSNYYAYRSPMMYLNGNTVIISHSEFANNTGNSDLIHIDVNTVIISHSVFVNNNRNYDLVDVTGNTVTITHIKFVNNTRNRDLIELTGNNITISHNEFVNNIRNSHLVILSGNATTISHIELVGNTKTYDLVDVAGKTVTISNIEFVNNTRNQDLIDLTGNATVISHIEFVNNSRNYDLVDVSGNIVTVSHIEFVNNTRNYDLVNVAGNTVIISHSEFVNNTRNYDLVEVSGNIVTVSHIEFVNNTRNYDLVEVSGNIVTVSHIEFVNNTRNYDLVDVAGNTVIISHSEFVNNTRNYDFVDLDGNTITLSQSKFVNNNKNYDFVDLNGNTITISQSTFVNNTGNNSNLVYLNGTIPTISQNEFINNRVYSEVIYVRYHTTPGNITNNVFINSTAAYDVFISSQCRPKFSLSLGKTHCIECPENWHHYLVGIIIAAFTGGIALVAVMLALNMTVAVGTLNGILFYANVIAMNADTYFLPFQTSNFITVFISWLNLDIGFDVCFIKGMNLVHKALIQLAFPTYIIVLVIIVIVASECSSKFATILGKGNPVAVLDTMILLSYTKFFNAVVGSIYLLRGEPAYGSQNIHNIISTTTKIFRNLETSAGSLKGFSYFFLIVSILIFLVGILYTTLVFIWQWLVQCQDIVICKWVRHQKLHHFIEPYHAPYTIKYRFWTGFLLFMRVLLSIISISSLDPHVNLISTIFAVGVLLLIKGVTAKRIYKSWPLDIMETAIYFNIIAFAALTWYNLGSGVNQIAVAYTSVMITFILLLAAISFHFLRYTQFNKCSFVQKSFIWISSNLTKKTPREEACNDEIDGYQLERREDQAVTQSVIEIH